MDGRKTNQNKFSMVGTGKHSKEISLELDLSGMQKVRVCYDGTQNRVRKYDRMDEMRQEPENVDL